MIAELDVDQDVRMFDKLKRAHAAHRKWRRIPLADRITQVRECLTRFETDREAVASEITRQMGKPIVEARAEVTTMFDRAETSMALAEGALASELLPEKPGLVRRIEHRPLGVVFAIAAWNYPLLIPINVLVPGLLAGNAILLKHSPLTALTGRRFSRAFAGLEIADVVQDLIIEHEQAARLIADHRIAHVAFTGSVASGRKVYQTVASERLIDIGLELGGKDAAYVAEDADLEVATAGVVEGACYNAGQSCCAIERVYVHESRYREFLDRALPLVEGYVAGDPLKESTTLGPMARSDSLPHLIGQVADAKTRGARVLTGGQIMGTFFVPTLLSDVPQSAEVMRDESFGPIVPVAPVADDEDALTLMDDSNYGLTASIWTADMDRAERFASRLEVGTMYQNRCDYLDPAQPWTGVRDSGKGSSLSRSGFFHLTRRMSIHFRSNT